MMCSAEIMLQFTLHAILWYLVTVNWARAQTDNLNSKMLTSDTFLPSRMVIWLTVVSQLAGLLTGIAASDTNVTYFIPCIFILINQDSTPKHLFFFQCLPLPLIPIPVASPFPVCSISETPCYLFPKLAHAWILSQIFLKVLSFWHTKCVCPH